jgi:heme-degrading monooxygenase HmoA
MWMYASIRRYRMGAGSMDDAMHLADTEFADRLAEQPGFVDYQAVAVGDDMVVSMTIFEDEEQCLASNDAAAEFVGEHLGPFQVELIDVAGGEVMVSRAADMVLQPAHH